MSTTIDRTGWPSGPWDGEPDRVEWRTEAGLPALILRHPRYGHLCGYVGVPKGHPAWECGYHDIGAPFEVHDGLSYAGRNDDVTGLSDSWWLGFACAGAWDRSPMRPGDDGEEYRTIAFARAECERLAAQLAGMR